MFKALIRSLALILALQPTLALAQSPPATLPDHTVYGRIGTGGASGPGQAIPFNTLRSQMGVPDFGSAKIVIYADGQSNISRNVSLTWSPNPNVKIWNNPQDATGTGTAFGALSNTVIGFPEKFASDYADANPGTSVYLIKNGYTGQPIARWTGDGVSPAMYVNGTNNLVAGLAAIGASKISLYLRWQIEADTGSLGSYAASYATMMGRYWGNAYFPKETPSVIMAMASTAISADSNADAANAILSGIANSDPDKRRYVYTPALSDAGYWNSPHMTATGYFAAGAMAANAYLHGGRANVAGTSYNAGTDTWSLTGNLAISGSSGISLPGGGGVTGTGSNLSGFLNVNTTNLTATTINAFALGGGITGNSNNINGVGFFNHVAITQPAGSSTLTIADGKTFTASNTLTLTGTDGSSVAFGTGGTVFYTSQLAANMAAWLATPSSANLRAALTDETGTGLAYFQGGDIGTPSAGVGTNLSGTAASLTAGHVTTNANMTGDVTSVGNATTLAAGNAGNLNSGTLLAARLGFAAKSDMQTPSSSTLVVNPRDVQDHPGVAKFHARLDGKTGATCTVTAGYNVSGCVRNSSGNYTITFTTAFANANYDVTGTGWEEGVSAGMIGPSTTAGYATGTFTFLCIVPATGTVHDCNIMNIQGFGTQ